MFCSLGDDPLVAHGEDLRGEVVAVDKLGVAEHLGLHAEEFVNFFVVNFHLVGEFIGVGERRE